MGTAVASIYITASRAEELRREFPGHDFASLLENDAFEEWRFSDEYANRYSTDRAMVAAELLEPMAPQRATHEEVVAGAKVIPVLSEESVTVRRKSVTVERSAEQVANLRGNWKFMEMREAFAELGTFPLNAKIEKLPAPRKPQVKSTEGELETVYFLVTPRDLSRRGDSTFSSLSEARAEAVRQLTANPELGTLKVRSKRVRVNEGVANEDLLEVTVPEKGGKVTFSYDEEVPTKNPVVEKYLVLFTYHY